MAKQNINYVISGDYIGKKVSVIFNIIQINTTFADYVAIDTKTVTQTKIIYEGVRKEGMFLKKKYYHVQIDFRNGKRSIVEVDKTILDYIVDTFK